MIGKSLKKWWPLFVLPTFAAFIIGFLWPFIWGIGLSFCRFTTVENVKFVGFDNYRKLLDPVFNQNFGHAFWLTVVFALLSTVLINIFGFLVALALTKKFRGTNTFRTVFFLPNLIGGIVLGYIWNTLVNGLLISFGTNLTLKTSGIAGFWGLTTLLLWQQIGYMMIIYIAGINNVPEDLVEAAEIDGGTPLQILFKVKLPMIMPSITICTFLTLTNGFKLFDQNLALTGGEPQKMTELLALNIYNTYYGRAGQLWMGLGQAKAVIFFLVVVVIALLQLNITSRKETQY